jgi:hypothetical protein
MLDLSAWFPGPVRVDRYVVVYDWDMVDDEREPLKEINKTNESGYGDTKAIPPIKYAVDQQKNAYLLDVWSIANLGILASYFGIGFVGSFTKAPLQYYILDTLDASSQQYSIYTVMHRLPWSIKFIFGFLSGQWLLIVHICL